MSSLGLARSRRVVPGPLLLALFYLLLQAPRIDAQFLTRAYALQRLSGVQNALFQIKLAERIVEGPGLGLSYGLYPGNTIQRETFETQFVQDIAMAGNLSTTRIFVTAVEAGAVSTDWEPKSVIVTFRMFEKHRSNDTITLAQVVEDLTYQIQRPSTRFYRGVVLRLVDPHFGLVALSWDVSLLLRYALHVVGEGAVDRDEINEGSTRFCANYNYTSSLQAANPHPQHSSNGSWWATNKTADYRPYCQFELWYRQDLARALNISLGRIQVLFIKNASLDSVLVHTRFSPPNNWTHAEHNISDTISLLSKQLHNVSSSLYLGNVTVRSDRSWGLSGSGAEPRGYNPFVRYASMPTSTDEYERCKAVHRCARADFTYNQSDAAISFQDQLFEAGQRFPSALFADFEGWQSGTFGWAHRGLVLASTGRLPKPRGAHFSPMAFASQGPTVPTAGFRFNRGLVLDNSSKALQLEQLDAAVSEYQARISFMQRNIETALLDARARSRTDVRAIMTAKINRTTALMNVQVTKRQQLAVSQCALVNCTLHFNTSALTLTGAITANGTLAHTSNGTEVAVFSFDSIQLGPEVQVTLAGQRALVLTSRSSVSLNTSFTVLPGTLGGFPGGFAVGQRAADRLTDTARDIFLRELGDLNGTASNNVNGPGSGSVRVYRYTVQTRCSDVDEVQRITTAVRRGQTIRGGFAIGYGPYRSRLLPHDASAALVKAAIEGDLNPCDPYSTRACSRGQGGAPGVGLVNVTRGPRSDEGCYNWTVTFTTAVGDVDQLWVSDELTGVGSGVTARTLVHGNTMAGSFRLRFLNSTTRPLASNASAQAMASALQQDVPALFDVQVLRTDPTGHCSDGLCRNGPTPGYGYTWTLTLTTLEGNVSPTSPTGNSTTLEAPFASLAVAGAQLSGQGATVDVEAGHGRSPDDMKRAFNSTRPFSLAYGGGGAGYGGQGGAGYGHNPPPVAYGNVHVSELLGGSGGAMGDVDPAAIHAYDYPQGRGGAGGGAIEIIAINDIVIGSKGVVVVDAQDGTPASQFAGGGGSGGSVLLSAGGVIVHEGLISATGGDGGKTQRGGRGGGGGAGGRVAMYAQSVTLQQGGVVDVSGGRCPGQDGPDGAACGRHGENGTFYRWTQMGARYYVDSRSGGVFSTQRSLYLTSGETTPTVSGVVKETPYPRDGPEYRLQSGRPEQITFFVKLGTLDRGRDPQVRRKQNWNWGAMFALLSDHNSTVGVSANASVGLGLTFRDTIRHGVDFYYTPWERTFRPDMTQVLERMDLYTWYKVDILLYWEGRQTYDVRIDDVTHVRQARFTAPSFSRIGLYVFPRGEVWFDEIFAGTDHTMQMQCPLISPTGVQMDRPVQNSWPAQAIGGYSYNHPMTRWLSHIAQRPEYDYNNGGIVPFDGEAHQAYMSDIQVRFDTGDKVPTPGSVLAGVLTTLEGSTPSRVMQSASLTSVVGSDFWTSGEDVASNRNLGKTSTYFWYGEHTYEEGIDEYRGGVASCSTDDFITWRFEGIMLHYANITDMVFGTPGPFVVERPKVLYNAKTGKYVMWMSVDNANRSLGLAGLAVSDYRNGPYDFIRTFYPDGNETRDQMVYQAPDGTAYLGRTYYQDVEYVLPDRVMQPIWEGVRNADGSINFPLNYHRAYYDADYDDYNDIFQQRWRKEDISWKVVCINRVTGNNRTVDRSALSVGDSWCTAPFEYKVVEGFGFPAVPTRYIDPNDDSNSIWSPNSVPGVQAQPWKYNYRDGECGLHKTNDGWAALDPNMEFSKALPDRANCSNVADNKPHQTVADKLIGDRKVFFTRRAKYVAVSKLTDDYLDTSGVLMSFEGELEGEEHLISLITQSGQFQWDAGQQLGSTYFPQVSSEFQTASDWDRRFHQYERQYNDRAYYSLACVLDGDCPVDFKAQLTTGNV